MAKDEKVEWISGVRVITKETRVILDPTHSGVVGKGDHRFISHAHADHTQGISSRAATYTTAATRMLYERIRKKPVKDFREIRIRHRVRLDDVEVVPINAGHMLGSVQFKIVTPNKTLLYTGDLNCIDTLTTDKAESVQCDLLLMEATYGNPFYVFPDREATYAEIIEWATQRAKVGHVPTFHVYAAGKAQEIVRLFNVYTKLPVVVSPLVSAANEIYNNAGLRLEYSVAGETSDQDLETGPYVYVTTPSDSLLPARCERAVATGWALRSSPSRFPAFPLSSHADFRQLVEFVRLSRAKTVYLFTGYSALFSAYLRKRFGIDARPIPQVTQKRLLEFSR